MAENSLKNAPIASQTVASTSAQPISPTRKRARVEEEETGNRGSPNSKNRHKRMKSGTTTGTDRDEPAPVVDEHYSNNGGDVYLKLMQHQSLFLCHTAKLKTAGGLFGDLFALPQPSDDEEQIDGIPFCPFFQDLTPIEFRFVLDAIYGKIKLLRRLRSGKLSVHFTAAIAILKGAHLLNLPKLRETALKALHLLFPCDSKDDRWPPAVHGANVPRDLFQRLFPIQAVKVFALCDVPLYLPMALYYATQLDISDIVLGVKRPDGTVETLSDADKILLLKSKDKLRALRKKHTHGWLMEHGDEEEHEERNCSDLTNAYTDQSCYDFLENLKADWEESGLFDGADCFHGVPKEAMAILKRDLCSNCYEAYEPRIAGGIWDAWWELPSVYGLGSWEELKERQESLSSGWRE